MTREVSVTHFTHDEAETQRLHNLSKVDQGMNGDLKSSNTDFFNFKTKAFTYKPVFFRFEQKVHQNHPEDLLKQMPALIPRVSNSVDLGWALRLCISKMLWV